ncbi:unnamed protein product [Paramecium sonneborni]|uniref:Uncharacterized protein n=1 Tax=Paramecium sonneborni TaxID=65129 RepID=A0A8S1Q393_9CILI|nr:unnamed protein product [Paramecium sonneborni]
MEGFFLQFYSPDNIKIGEFMKVTENTRRLLTDIITTDYEFLQLKWILQQTDVNLKKFSSEEKTQSENILLEKHQQTVFMQLNYLAKQIVHQ